MASAARRDEDNKVACLEVKNLDELLQRVGSLRIDQGLRIQLPVDVKISEYKKIAEFADTRGYEIVDEAERLKMMMQVRNDELVGIDRTVDRLEDCVRHLNRRMNL